MHLDLSDDEAAAPTQELHRLASPCRRPRFTRHREPRGDGEVRRTVQTTHGNDTTAQVQFDCHIAGPGRKLERKLTLYVLDYLADPGCARRPGDALCADYRLLCSGSVYRRTEGEWYKYEGARFLLEPPLLLYAASRPFDKYPLELVLRLTVAHVEETRPARWGNGQVIGMFHPDEEVARDLAALLTVLCRRLITVMGKSAEQHAKYEYPKFDRIPLPVGHLRRVYWPPYPATVMLGWNSQEIIDNNPPPTPVDPDRLTARGDKPR